MVIPEVIFTLASVKQDTLRSSGFALERSKPCFDFALFDWLQLEINEIYLNDISYTNVIKPQLSNSTSFGFVACIVFQK